MLVCFFFSGGRAVWAESPKPEIPETTRITIQTTGPAAYRHLYQSNPPRILFHFLTDTVYSSMQESVQIQRGIVKDIRVEYFSKKESTGGRRPVKRLIFNLLADTTYEVFEGPNAITLSILNPKGIQESIVQGKVLLTTFSPASVQEQRRKEELSKALEKSILKKRERAKPPTPSAILPSHPSMAVNSRRVFWGPLFFLIALLLGGFLWPSAWPSVRFPAQRREREHSWEMAKRLMGLKEEMAAKESRFNEGLSSHQKQERFLTSQIAYLKEINQGLTQESQRLQEEQRQLQRELGKRAADVEELVLERSRVMERMEAVQKELEETKILQEQTLRELEDRLARLDKELTRRQETIPLVSQQQERRQCERLSIPSLGKRSRSMAVEVRGPAGRIIYGFPQDLGDGGIAFELKEKVDLPDPVSLKLHFPNRESTVEATGRIAWKNDQESSSRYGVSFDTLPHGTGAFISQFIRNHLAHRSRPQVTEDGSPVRFQFHAPEAQSVSVAGDFNNWDTKAHPMHRSDDGLWTLTLGLVPGTYQYKFFVDGRWEADPSATKRALDPFGGENALLEVN